jgi:hypothetical protein
MNELKVARDLNKKKFINFVIGFFCKLIGYSILFYIDWKIGVGVFLADRGSDFVSRSI